ncbi:uncharacterized protein PRCAT00004929001 [Priceomyces carsonii]|uniref:uncharacterized protein n=1 Tax=Priceomyces carsonii TaxID=28549 RepID=UPI002ED7B714|nr:unnamed protein product [Priceomyces carsonii]
MKPSLAIFKSVKIRTAKPDVGLLVIPSLSSVRYDQLPNNGFGFKNYSISKSKFGHWPVYLKIQNTKISTEIKHVRGDIKQFRNDLLKVNPNLHITINEKIGYANIKGDHVQYMKGIFQEHL